MIVHLWEGEKIRALIIAAGRGERLRPFTDEQPKPLVPLLGLRLIERVILSAKEAGIKEFAIVTGYLGREVMKFLGDGSRYHVKIEYVENGRWEKGNGVSVYEATKLLDESFVLLMSDHIFDPGILSELKRCELGEEECILCVDKGMRCVFDMDDATKVNVVDGKIEKIGKGLTEYNGVDMGIFLCSPYIFEVLKRNIENGRYSLTETIRELARESKMKAYCIDDGETYWIDIDTFQSLKIAREMLLVYGADLEPRTW
ncbi:MAG: phosphocholine cytidylyltransferase family protein [Candidatus Bathyarchaeota archaeon]|nr:phosphocholine cytidylyltransferase family protein [Candidatus Bathyarchaeota archaeon]